VNLDSLRDLQLVSTDDGRLTFPVREVVIEGGALIVRAAAPDDAELRLSAVNDTAFMLRALRERLAAVTDPGLATPLVLGALPPLQLADTDHQGMKDRARQATCAPGMSAIWGPPGTGKTTVTAAAIAQLVRERRTVLLVSNTNVAVDNALQRAAHEIQPPAGQLLRVGRPDLSEVADDPRLALDRILEDHNRDATARRDAIDRRLDDLANEAASSSRRRNELEQALRGFDRGSFEAALERVQAEQAATRRRRRLAAAEEALLAAGRRRAAAESAVGQAMEALAIVQPARDARLELEELRPQLADLARAQAEARARRRELEAQLQVARSADAMSRPRLLARLRRALGVGPTARLERDINDTFETVIRADQTQAELRTRMEFCQRLLRDHPPDELDRLEGALREAEAAHRAAADEEERLRREHVAARAAIEGDRLLQAPSAHDRELVQAALGRRLPELDDELRVLRNRATQVAAERTQLEQEGTQLVDAAAGVRRALITRAQVVATTLAQLALNRDVHSRDFDHVIVDEVSAALPPYVVYAASRAARGVTLLGDFLQKGPISALPDDTKEPVADRWLLRDAFAVLGITSAEQAETSPGCSMLTEQFRFGPDVNELANRVAYGHRLQAGHQHAPVLVDDGLPEIVFIDVDGLGSVAERKPGARGSRWWPIGALLSRALAARHLDLKQRVGIVTPFTAQRDATAALLQDADLDPKMVEVGTAHQFQGRQSDVVVLDLVEDGTGWISKAANRPEDRFSFGGFRVFNVGLTRTRGRIYVIATNAALAKAKPGQPLASLRAMLDEGRAIRLGADELVDVQRAPTALPSPTVEDLRAALQGFSTDIEIHNESTFNPLVAPLVDAARRSVLLWSPFLGRRMSDVLPSLDAAVGRGVDVLVVTRPPRDMGPDHAKRLATLRDARPRVVEVYGTHEKVLVLDEQASYVGSLNVLSHKTTREVMVRVPGTQFAKRLQQLLGVATLRRPGSCPRHRSPAYAQRFAGGWSWRCPERACTWKKPFRN
jgi:KaiC/GvpD/RAD55 family RecA-like ATPase